MRTNSFRALVLSTCALVATGCDSLFFIEAEAEEICKAEPDVDFPAAFPGTLSIEYSMEFPLGDFDEVLPQDTDVETELRLKGFEVTSSTDLSGIERASVSVVRPGTSESILIGEYRRTNTSPTQSIRLTGSGAVNLLDMAREDALELTFEARGSLPTRDWNARIEACAGVRAKANYFDLVF
ncbi:hypothetical protein HUA74_34245 [Myxococcus sp. CA051A]|uniref:Lipoprotein n=1 Tax=Myxococcus llanfairpwllgwyngyllgogerychwyrndrobwllllantysiliogogogochensis TaxID=2590453 RepID=A0A540WW46_9BACT|nr:MULTISPECIES: hypothetical protein [Myxococcus]NTX03409.1 hypothetical protein [Myxococcus sp. CA040A]NTX11820.1 hypothetical protein [Myxococcus sp. CA056]NTX34078.1 hypothetical protein [Myxococcus sp. CA033]NTX65734.1 hypothetical protein [Myxococcus sp. CA051A]TQF13238.1 hypothetical protein FJV41_24890 [Myxococcus llanfairpwllgwyngyllgogerychwyrndrobwllllantysiliogogogochensis]